MTRVLAALALLCLAAPAWAGTWNLWETKECPGPLWAAPDHFIRCGAPPTGANKAASSGSGYWRRDYDDGTLPRRNGP
jgi:hypothetical protein